MSDNTICVEDFCGNHRQDGFWADYNVDTSITEFGGDWMNVPDMHTPDHVPTDIECHEWAKAHGWKNWDY